MFCAHLQLVLASVLPSQTGHPDTDFSDQQCAGFLVSSQFTHFLKIQNKTIRGTRWIKESRSIYGPYFDLTIGESVGKGRTDSPVRSIQHCLAVYQNKLLLQISIELHPGLTPILLPLNRPNTNVLLEKQKETPG